MKNISCNRRAKWVGLMLSTSLLIASCSSGGSTPPPVAVVPPVVITPPPVTGSTLFSDVTDRSGINVTIGTLGGLTSAMIPMFLAHGVASGDYDNDGDIDLFIVRGNNVSNLLYRNDGGMNFVDVADAAGSRLPKPRTQITATARRLLLILTATATKTC